MAEQGGGGRVNTPSGTPYAPGGFPWPPEAYPGGRVPSGVPTYTGPVGGPGATGEWTEPPALAGNQAPEYTPIGSQFLPTESSPPEGPPLFGGDGSEPTTSLKPSATASGNDPIRGGMSATPFGFGTTPFQGYTGAPSVYPTTWKFDPDFGWVPHAAANQPGSGNQPGSTGSLGNLLGSSDSYFGNFGMTPNQAANQATASAEAFANLGTWGGSVHDPSFSGVDTASAEKMAERWAPGGKFYGTQGRPGGGAGAAYTHRAIKA